MPKAIIVMGGKVIEVLPSYIVERDTKWLVGTPPDNVRLVPNDTDVAVGDYISPTGTIDTLGRYKEAKLLDIRAGYKEFEASGAVMLSLGYPVQCGQTHVQKFDGAVRFAEQTGAKSIYITDANDVTHYDVPLADAKQALLEVTGAALKAHALKQELRARVEAAETKEDIEAIRWEIGGMPSD